MLTLGDISRDFSQALEAADRIAETGRSVPWRYRQRGVGALNEADTLSLVMAHMRSVAPKRYGQAEQRAYPASHLVCDLTIPGEWAIEVRRVRAFTDSGTTVPYWSAALLHPYAAPDTALNACYLLVDAPLTERRALLLFGYEHIPAEVPLLPAAMAFEGMIHQVTTLQLGERQTAITGLLQHPVHQRGVVYAWQISQPGV